MYLTRIAGIETWAGRGFPVIFWMYLTRIAGIETGDRKAPDKTYPRCILPA